MPASMLSLGMARAARWLPRGCGATRGMSTTTLPQASELPNHHSTFLTSCKLHSASNSNWKCCKEYIRGLLTMAEGKYLETTNLERCDATPVHHKVQVSWSEIFWLNSFPPSNSNLMECKWLPSISLAAAFLPAHQTWSTCLSDSSSSRASRSWKIRGSGLWWYQPTDSVGYGAARLPAIPVLGESWTAAQKIMKNPNFVLFCSEISLHAAALQAASHPALGSELEFCFTVTFPTLLSTTDRYILFFVCFLWFSLSLVAWHNLFKLSTS